MLLFAFWLVLIGGSIFWNRKYRIWFETHDFVTEPWPWWIRLHRAIQHKPDHYVPEIDD